ncbi:MAG TPA: DUF5666 domain-containing protein [Candidatus Dormibacteraeota bacterium]|jgi:hypothetical protein|nr:DUF5666 domain-containing protein [Candidatus Dormibacteraeota bacterium]
MSTKTLLALPLLLFWAGTATQAQEAPTPDQQPGPPPQGQRPPRRGQGDGAAPLVGKIMVLKSDSLQLAKPDGATVTVNFSDKTEFRKDRQPAKASDFKVGDMIFVRGDQNKDNTVTAAVIAARTGNGPAVEEGGRGFGGGSGFALGELGKDYVAGEVKSVDAPKLTVLRPDNVTQTIELNEESSLRKGRESITMAEIQPGDHVVARGALQNNVFTPKNVMILSAEQWQRMQEMGGRRRGNAEGEPHSPSSNAPPANPPQQ